MISNLGRLFAGLSVACVACSAPEYVFVKTEAFGFGSCPREELTVTSVSRWRPLTAREDPAQNGFTVREQDFLLRCDARVLGQIITRRDSNGLLSDYVGIRRGDEEVLLVESRGTAYGGGYLAESIEVSGYYVRFAFSATAERLVNPPRRYIFDWRRGHLRCSGC